MFSVNGRELSLPTTDYSTEASRKEDTQLFRICYQLRMMMRGTLHFFSLYWKYIRCLLILTKLWK